MRDDISSPNIGQAGKNYDSGFFYRSYRDIEIFISRLLSKGPAIVSTLTADEIDVADLVTLGTVTWSIGIGSPEGVVTAAVGSLYSRTDGGVSTTLYVKQTGTGNTGWAAK